MLHDQPELVWNKGIASLCDRRIPDEFPGGGAYVSVRTLAGENPRSGFPGNLISNLADYQDVPEGALIWVRLTWLKSFVSQVLPLLKNRIVLVTGDSDGSTPSEAMPEARAILKSLKIIRWYAQNCDGSVSPEKVSPIPIGIDFHTLSERPFWGEKMSSPPEQELTLKSIRDRLPAPQDRIPLVYLDFGWQETYGSRELKGAKCGDGRLEIIRRLRNNRLCVLQERLSQTETWRRRGEYLFVVSPHGNGLDCHRTWEALALGHIVVTPSSSLDSMYEGLPVITIDNYDAITEENLMEWKSRFADWSGNGAKLTSSYWVDVMRRAARECIESGV
jgi:hypothetical protein